MFRFEDAEDWLATIILLVIVFAVSLDWGSVL